jgi:hypothetical protein
MVESMNGPIIIQETKKVSKDLFGGISLSPVSYE